MDQFVSCVLLPRLELWRQRRAEAYRKTLLSTVCYVGGKPTKYVYSSYMPGREGQSYGEISDDARTRELRIGEQIASVQPDFFEHAEVKYSPGQYAPFYCYLASKRIAADCDDFDLQWMAYNIES